MPAEDSMASLTIRNVPPKVVKSLKTLARQNHRSMEQEVRALLDEYVGDRLALLEQVEAAWSRQARRPAAREVDAWITAGRK
jgi:plasmid stability protein